MASVSIVKQRLTIKCDTQEQMASLLGIIGTMKVDEGDPTLGRCRASVQNLQRIKRVVRGVKLSNDAPTKFAIQNMMAERDEIACSSRELLAAVKNEFPVVPYKFKVKPYKHQIFAFNAMHAGKNIAIFGDCGVGKTAIAAWFIESLYKLKELCARDNVLVICPINIITHAWMEDVEKFTGLKVVSLYEPSSYKRKEKIAARFKQKADIYITSFSQLRLREKELRNKKFKLIVVDESSKIKNARSRVFRSLLQVSWKAEWKFIMSGTPAPNGAIDLWSQFFFLDGGLTLEPSIVDFRNAHYMSWQMGGRIPIWSPKTGSAARVGKIIASRSITMRAKDCLDLPKRSRIARRVEQTAEERRIYEEMAQNLVVELDTGEMSTARIALSKIMKLREITGGFIMDDDGQPHQIGESSKMQALDGLVESIMESGEHKALIWIQYRWEADTALKMLKKKYGAAVFYGGLSQKVKDNSIKAFRTDPKARILICHPASIAHGITLNEAQYTIYYSLSHDYEHYYQSSRRNYRAGQDKPVFEYHLVTPATIDESLLICLQGKHNFEEEMTSRAINVRDLLGIR